MGTERKRRREGGRGREGGSREGGREGGRREGEEKDKCVRAQETQKQTNMRCRDVWTTGQQKNTFVSLKVS